MARGEWASSRLLWLGFACAGVLLLAGAYWAGLPKDSMADLRAMDARVLADLRARHGADITEKYAAAPQVWNLPTMNAGFSRFELGRGMWKNATPSGRARLDEALARHGDLLTTVSALLASGGCYFDGVTLGPQLVDCPPGVKAGSCDCGYGLSIGLSENYASFGAAAAVAAGATGRWDEALSRTASAAKCGRAISSYAIWSGDAEANSRIRAYDAMGVLLTICPNPGLARRLAMLSGDLRRTDPVFEPFYPVTYDTMKEADGGSGTGMNGFPGYWPKRARLASEAVRPAAFHMVGVGVRSAAAKWRGSYEVGLIREMLPWTLTPFSLRGLERVLERPGLLNTEALAGDAVLAAPDRATGRLYTCLDWTTARYRRLLATREAATWNRVTGAAAEALVAFARTGRWPASPAELGPDFVIPPTEPCPVTGECMAAAARRSPAPFGPLRMGVEPLTTETVAASAKLSLGLTAKGTYCCGTRFQGPICVDCAGPPRGDDIKVRFLGGGDTTASVRVEVNVVLHDLACDDEAVTATREAAERWPLAYVVHSVEQTTVSGAEGKVQVALKIRATFPDKVFRVAADVPSVCFARWSALEMTANPRECFEWWPVQVILRAADPWTPTCAAPPTVIPEPPKPPQPAVAVEAMPGM